LSYVIAWLNDLIGNAINAVEVVTSVVCFQIVHDDYSGEHIAIVVVNTEKARGAGEEGTEEEEQ